MPNENHYRALVILLGMQSAGLVWPDNNVMIRPQASAHRKDNSCGPSWLPSGKAGYAQPVPQAARKAIRRYLFHDPLVSSLSMLSGLLSFMTRRNKVL